MLESSSSFHDGVERKRILRDDITGKKGPVFATAIVAGTMAVKKTSDLIPFCHNILIDSCDINIDLIQETSTVYAQIDCIVKTTGKTGVEMEALVGVSNAALCIYDMLKAVSHEIRIDGIHLVSKVGGKSDYKSSDIVNS
jgi:molybdenum cofactor biosynthesis protein MoaC